MKQKGLPANSCLLVYIDGFYQAYGSGAFALARAMKYRVVRRHRPWGEVLTCGFPDLVLGMVCLRLRKSRSDVEMLEDNAFLIHNLDDTPDETMVWEAEDEDSIFSSGPTLCVTEDWLADAVASFNTKETSPDDAMRYVMTLQKRLKQATSCYRY